MELQRLYALFSESEGVSTDTRKLRENQIFFSLRGPSFEGNHYAIQALERGALAAVVDDRGLRGRDPKLIYFPDALQALQGLARHHREHCDATVLALTGSNGKTTTKELIHAVLRQQYPSLATEGNLNNRIGVPLTLLRIKPEHRFALIEMGASRQREIQALCEIAQPDWGCITNFGKAHLDGFDGFDGVVKGKSELYDFLRARGGKAFVNLDDALQVQKSAGLERFTFGENPQADVVLKYEEDKAFAQLRYQGEPIQSQLIGNYNSGNLAAALTIGLRFGLKLPEIRATLESYTPRSNRSQIISREGYQIILDAYNANPSSVLASLDALENLSGRKWIILGDMFELGQTSAEAHQSVVARLEALNPHRVSLIGDHFYQTTNREETHFERFKTYADFAQERGKSAVDVQHILVKGSRNMALERILALI